MMQSHFVQAFFTRSVRITFRALLTSSSCSVLTSPDNPARRHIPGNNFLQTPDGVFHGEGVPVTDDDGATVATGGEPVDRLPAHCNDRCPVRVVSAGPQPVQLHDAVFQVAIAAPERLGEVRYYGTINNEAQAVRQLQGLYGNILSCYEAGPCGFGLYHQLTAMNIKC